MGRLLNSDFIPPDVGPRPVKPPLPATDLPRNRYIPPAAAVPAVKPQVNTILNPQDNQNNPFRKLTFYFGMAMLLVIAGAVPELLYHLTNGANLYVLYLITPPAIVGVLLCGAVKRTFRHRAAWYWLGFYMCMVISVPFSSWRGASLGRLYDYSRVCMIIMFILAGLPNTWKEMRVVFHTLAISGVISLLATRFFGVEENGRLILESSTTIGNSNDLAAHLITLLPFILFVVMDRSRNFFIRYSVFAPPIFYGIWVIFGTASRGAVMAMAAMFLYTLWRANPARRMVALVVAGVTAIALPALMPDGARTRLMTLFGGEHEEAKESQESRNYLFRQSIVYTLQHPFLGVGPDQFANYEGNDSVQHGKTGNWHATHCAFTQVSSECGIPALIFFLLGIGSAMSSVSKVYAQARQTGYKEIAAACFCYMISMIGLIVAITFLSNAYRFYLPCMVGLAISLSTIARQHMASQPADVEPRTFDPQAFAPQVFAVR